jgi:hypothetical protein
MAIYRLLENRAFGPDESLPPHTMRRCARCAWPIDPIPRPRSLQKRSSSWHNEVSAIRSGCASARFDLCRNRSPTQKLNAYRLPGWTSEREAAAGVVSAAPMLEIAIALIVGFALGYGVREWVSRRRRQAERQRRSFSRPC